MEVFSDGSSILPASTKKGKDLQKQVLFCCTLCPLHTNKIMQNTPEQAIRPPRRPFLRTVLSPGVVDGVVPGQYQLAYGHYGVAVIQKKLNNIGKCLRRV